MASQVPTHYVQQFSSNLQLLLQQEDTRLSGAVTTGSHSGEQASPVDQYGAINANEIVGRYNPIGNTEAPTARRWVTPRHFDVNQLVDSFDKLLLLTDPTSTNVRNAVAALNREKDREILSKIFSDNKVGKSGTETQAFGSGQVVGVAHGAAAATGGSVAKLREARRLLMKANNNMNEQIYAAINADFHDDLLAEIQVISMDYNNRPVLVDGMIDQFLGIKFIHTELVAQGTDDAAGTSYQIPVWMKSGMYLGVWSDVMTSITQRNDLQGLPFQAYAKASFGATRLEENKIVKIWAR
jgi:hypothetical protein